MSHKTWIKILIFLQLVLFILVVWVMLRPTKLSNQMIVEKTIEGTQGQQGTSGYSPIKGVDYFDGLNGKDGKDGTDGKSGVDGISPTPEQVKAAVTSYCTDNNNCQGERGESGAPSRQLEQRCYNGQIQQRYEGDDTWETLYYLPKGASCGQ